MKKNISILMLSALCATAMADGFTTQGDGTTYSLAALSSLEGSNVERWDYDDEVVYMIYDDVTIAQGDRFVMDDGVTVQFDDQVTLTIEGEADFRLTTGAVFESAYDDADYVSPVGIVVKNEQSVTEFIHCQFYYVGLRGASEKGMNLSQCAFYYNNGAIGQGALTIGTDGAPYSIADCTFEYNNKAAIAGAANYHNPLTITGCTFTCNGQKNGNIPQLNLTAAEDINISNCTIAGDPQLTMVGGIGISNYYAAASKILISGCTIRDNRYGIGTVGPATIRIEGNQLLDNHYETNPMQGGSGISLYDPYGMTDAVIAQNRIEGNLWGVTIIGCRNVDLGQPASSAISSPGLNVFKDNGFDGQLYDLYNNSTLTVYAQNNLWNVDEQTEEKIETVIFHKHDNDQLGEVIFMPAGEADGIDRPESNGNSGDGMVFDLGGRRVAGHVAADHRHKMLQIMGNGKKVVR